MEQQFENFKLKDCDIQTLSNNKLQKLNKFKEIKPCVMNLNKRTSVNPRLKLSFELKNNHTPEKEAKEKQFEVIGENIKNFIQLNLISRK